MECGVSLSPAASSLCPQKPRVMAGTVKLEDKQRLAQEEESEAKCPQAQGPRKVRDT